MLEWDWGSERLAVENSLAQHWARDWRALALTQVHHWSRLSDSREDGEALSSVHSTALAAGKLIHENHEKEFFLNSKNLKAGTHERIPRVMALRPRTPQGSLARNPMCGK